MSDENTYLDQESRAKAAKEQGKIMDAQGAAISSLIPILIAAVVIVTVVLIIIALFRSVFLWLSSIWLYPAVILATLAAYVIIKKFLKKGTLLAFLAAASIGVVGWTGARTYYMKTVIHPSVFCADFIQALPNGKAPLLYEKVGLSGNNLSDLSIDEKVTVNGMSYSKKAFNITTADGVTGWVELAAFPEDAAKTRWSAIGLDGFERGDMPLDRQVKGLAEKYLEKAKGYKDKYVMPEAMLRSSGYVSETTISFVKQKAHKKGKEMQDAGVKLKLVAVGYKEDCTIVYMSVTDSYDRNREWSKHWDLSGALNSTGWKNSFTVTDLDTGEKWKALSANYRDTYHETPLDKNGEKMICSVVFFFPKFNSRHFSLTHEAPALPDKTGYGGILGWMASFSGSWTGNKSYADYFIDYNFPEVKVK